MRKVFVDVITNYTKEGQVIPLSITWEDGTRYDIDKVLDQVKTASLKVGGVGVRYKCKIQGKEKHIFFDSTENKWFVEAK